MRAMFRAVLLLTLCGISLAAASAQGLPICPDRPFPGQPITYPMDLYSQNGVLNVDLLMQNAVDGAGFMHYCYIYMYQGQQIEAPTLRLNPGDTLVMNLTNNLQAPFSPSKTKHASMHQMHMTHQGPADDCNGNPILESST